MINSTALFELNEQGIGTITLNRPQLHNAFDEKMIETLSNQLETIAQSPDIRLVVIKANGKSFSAGADLNWMQKMTQYTKEENQQDANALAILLNQLYTLPQPTIALVHGNAFGGGVGLVACCDIVIASETAEFCFSEVKLGLIPAVISPYVIKAIGARQAKRYFISAEQFSASEAKILGLVDEVLPHYDLEPALNHLLQDLLENGPQAMRAIKRLVLDIQDYPIDETLMEVTSHCIAAIRVSEEGQQGLKAFLTKRKPDWTATFTKEPQ